MISKRIEAIASFVSLDNKVLDVGCDHGYLSIYLKKNNLCNSVYACDISSKALNSAINNFKKYNVNIETFLSDGFKNVDVFFDTAVIAGVGTSTILKIINDKKCPKKLILASNNDYYELRKNLIKLGFRINNEIVVKENNHYYVIMNCFKEKTKMTKKELLFGISNNQEYYKYLYEKNKELISKVPLKKKLYLFYENSILKGFIEKK